MRFSCTHLTPLFIHSFDITPSAKCIVVAVTKWATQTIHVLYTRLLSKGLLHPWPISIPLSSSLSPCFPTDFLIFFPSLCNSLWLYFMILSFKKTNNTGNILRRDGLKASHASETILWVLNGNEEELSRRRLTNTKKQFKHNRKSKSSLMANVLMQKKDLLIFVRRSSQSSA